MVVRPDIQREILPDDLVPVRYVLSLTPDLVSCEFSGSVDIVCDVDVATNEVSLHASDLVANAKKISFEVFGQEGAGRGISTASIACKTLLVDPISMVWTITFQDFLPVGKSIGAVRITDFRGVLNDQLKGFYRSAYTARDGKNKVYMAVTQFEPCDARMCFPCWDEPERKAVFDVSINVKDDRCLALSNMPETSKLKQADGSTKFTFERTPLMSTYLLAFAVGDFDRVSGICKSGTQLSCYSPPGQGHELPFSLKVGIRVLDWFNEFFKINYPLPKMDQIAIPDFSAGAMENWGLVTYREVLLLCDEKKTSAFLKKRIASIIAHEFAHQWFGNLVTMRWWNDLWLNEGFATFMSVLCIDALFPEWNCWEEFVSVDQQNALKLDALRSSHPIQVPVPKGHEVMSNFDHISYFKGESVIRMIYAVLGACDFQKGLQLYMSRHQYSNTQTVDLWSAWEEVSGKPVAELMSPWTDIMGYPLITCQMTSSNAAIKVSQKWFIADNSEESGDQDKKWVVPVFVSSSTTKTPAMTLLKEKSAELPVAAGTWFKVNGDQCAPIRVLYDDAAMFGKLVDALKGGNIACPDRIGLLMDTFTLTKSGHLRDVTQVFKLLKAFEKEDNTHAWGALAGVIKGEAVAPSDGLSRFMQLLSDPVHDAFKAYCANIVRGPFESIGWDHKSDDTDQTKQLRATLVSLACSFVLDKNKIKSGACPVWKECTRRFEAFVSDASTPLLPDDYKGAVFVAVMRHTATASGPEAEEALFDKIHSLSKAASTSPMVSITLYAALGHAQSVNLKKKVCHIALHEVKAQDIFTPLNGLYQSGPQGQKILREWAKENWQGIYDKIGVSFILMRVVQTVFASCNTADCDDVEKFFKTDAASTYASVEKKVKQVLEEARASAQFLKSLESSPVNDVAFFGSLNR